MVARHADDCEAIMDAAKEAEEPVSAAEAIEQIIAKRPPPGRRLNSGCPICSALSRR